jgi:hypothetical protein
MFEAVPFQWQEESTGRFGDGISRPLPKAKTRQYRVLVYPAAHVRSHGSPALSRVLMLSSTPKPAGLVLWWSQHD